MKIVGPLLFLLCGCETDTEYYRERFGAVEYVKDARPSPALCYALVFLSGEMQMTAVGCESIKSLDKIVIGGEK